MIRLVVLGLLAGCFSKPGLVGNGDGGADDGNACTPSKPSASGVFVDDDRGEYTVHMISSHMTFASDGAHYPFPISLRLDDGELIAPRGGCTVEDQVGIAVYPAYSVAGTQEVTDLYHVLRRTIVGAAYTELTVVWSHHQTCGAGELYGNGTSTFSFFPDDRIVRFDTVAPATNRVITTDECSCQASTNFIVTSYFGFAAARLSSYLASEATAPTTIPAINTENDGGVGGCFTTDGGDNVALRYSSTDDTRLRRASMDEVAFVLDLARQSTLGPDNPATLGGQMQMMTRNNGDYCGALNDQLENHMAMTQVDIADELVAVGTNGYYDDAGPPLARAHTGPITVTASNGRIEAGFSLRVRFPGFQAVATSRNENRVFWQHEADDVFFLTFRDSLGSGDSIEIMPECGPT